MEGEPDIFAVREARALCLVVWLAQPGYKDRTKLASLYLFLLRTSLSFGRAHCAIAADGLTSESPAVWAWTTSPWKSCGVATRFIGQTPPAPMAMFVFFLAVLLKSASATATCLPNALGPNLRKNVTNAKGEEFPLGVVLQPYTSARLAHAIFEIIINEVLGYNLEFDPHTPATSASFLLGGWPFKTFSVFLLLRDKGENLDFSEGNPVGLEVFTPCMQPWVVGPGST